MTAQDKEHVLASAQMERCPGPHKPRNQPHSSEMGSVPKEGYPETQELRNHTAPRSLSAEALQPLGEGLPS